MRASQQAWNRCLTGLGALLLTAVGSVVVTPSAHAAVEPVRPRQWYLNDWNIEEVWKTAQGEGVTVAVVDTGVDSTHPDLAGQIIGEPLGTGDSGNHGTSMASLIAGTGRGLNGQGVFGVAPKAKIISFKADGMRGTAQAYPAALRAAADSPAQIINISSAGYPDPDASAAIAYAQQRGKLVVAGSGNLDKPHSTPVYPAADPGVLGVGGYDRTGKVWDNAVTGYWVSLAGPAPDVLSACTGVTRYCNGRGTSNATAITSGIAALLWSQHPEYTANQVIKVLIDSANKPAGPLPNDLLGYGNVTTRALRWTGDPGPPDVNPLIGKRGNLPPGWTSPSPSPPASTTPSAQPSSAAPASAAPDTASGASSDDGDSNTLVLIAAITGGAVLVLVVIGLIMRSRSNRRGPPPAMPPPQWR